MARGTGNKIMLRFSEQLIGDVTGLETEPLKVLDEVPSLNDIWLVPSSVWTGLLTPAPLSNLIDGSLSTYWSTDDNGVAWFRLGYKRPTVVRKISMYIGNSGYAFAGCKIEGSIDGATYVELANVVLTTTVGWKEIAFENSVHYLHYKVTALNMVTNRIWVYSLKVQRVYGEEYAFSVTGAVNRCAPEGELITNTYRPESVSLAPAAQIRIADANAQLAGVRNTAGMLTLERA